MANQVGIVLIMVLAFAADCTGKSKSLAGSLAALSDYGRSPTCKLMAVPNYSRNLPRQDVSGSRLATI